MGRGIFAIATSVWACLWTVLAVACCFSQTDANREIAARYAPIFHQALGSFPRGDYPTNFDFDGDWIGTNNWAHAGNRTYKLKGYIYYSVEETETHYYIHYAVFHARDYKGGVRKGVMYSDLLWLGARVLSKGHSPTGKLALAAIAHENDMEGALVVVDKTSGKPVFLETVHHNKFGRYLPAGSTGTADGYFKTSGDNVELYVQAKGHGIEALGTEGLRHDIGSIDYTYKGVPEDPEARTGDTVGYQLLPIATTLWSEINDQGHKTYAANKDYGTITIQLSMDGNVAPQQVPLGVIPSAFRGEVGGQNIARPPWGWFSIEHRKDPLGEWYFDPASVIKRDFELPDTFSTAYVRMPFWVRRSDDMTTAAGDRR